MTDRRMQNDIGHELEERGAFLEPSPGELRAARERTASNLRLLLEQRRFLLRVFLCGLVVSALIAVLIPNRYEAVERLMPPDNQATGTAMLGALVARGGAPGLGALAGDLLGVKNSGALFAGILESRTVQDRLIEDFDLKKVYHKSKMEDARIALGKHSWVSEDRKSGIISIGVTDHDPRRAAAMAQAYVTELDKLVAQVSTSSARRERIFLEERLTAVKHDLDGAAHQFSEFASKNTAIDIPAQGKAMVEAAATLQGQLIAAQSELSGLQAIYTDQNVRVRALRARVTELRAQLGKLGGDADPASAVAAKKDPASYPTIRQLPVLGVTYANLYRQTKIEETVYELLTQQYELAKVQEAKEIPSVKVLDAAVVPTKKTFPPRTLLTTSGALLGLSCAVLWLLAKRHWSAIDPQDPGKQFALEVFETLREDSRHLSPATALSWVMSRRKAKEEKASDPKEKTSGDELLTGKSFTRAAGRGTD
jgi:capsule polysaccharide export protein KpsE/RkpR